MPRACVDVDGPQYTVPLCTVASLVGAAEGCPAHAGMSEPSAHVAAAPHRVQPILPPHSFMQHLAPNAFALPSAHAESGAAGAAEGSRVPLGGAALGFVGRTAGVGACVGAAVPQLPQMPSESKSAVVAHQSTPLLSSSMQSAPCRITRVTSESLI